VSTKINWKRQRRLLILVKGTNNQEEIIVNIHVPNVGTPNFIKQTLLELKAQQIPTK
jgi:hypothetical protein